MEIVTGHRGTPHVTPYKVRDFNIGIVGAEDYVMNGGSELEAQLVSNNRIDIKDGSICMQGTHAVIPKNINDELTIENGMQGEKRIDLIVARYEKVADSGVESVNTVVLQGTPSKESPIVPGHVVGDIRNGDLKHEMPLYEVELDGINVIEVRPVFKKIVSAAEQQKMIELLNGKLNMEKIIIVRNNKKSAFRHPQAYGLTPVTCPDLFFDNSEGLFSHSNGAIVCNQDAIIHAHAHFAVASSAHYYTIAINNLYSDSELFYSYATSVGGYSGQTSNYFKVKKGDVISLSFGLNNSFSIAAKDLHAELDVRLVCVL